MNEQAKTVVVFWNYLNSEGADGRNAKNCKYASGTVAIGPCLTCSGLFEDKIPDNWEPKEVINQK